MKSCLRKVITIVAITCFTVFAKDKGITSGDYVLAETWTENGETFVTPVFVRVEVTGRTLKLTPITADDKIRAVGEILPSGKVKFISKPSPDHEIIYLSDFVEAGYAEGKTKDRIGKKTVSGKWVLKKLPDKEKK